MPPADLEIVYDGDCPFCGAYTRMLRLRQAAGNVDLIDARSDDPRVAEVQALGLDLDTGMVVRHRGQVFHGADAMHHLSVLSAPGGFVNGVMRAVFRAPRRAALLYPVLAAGRRLVLRLLGRKTLARARAEAGE